MCNLGPRRHVNELSPAASKRFWFDVVLLLASLKQPQAACELWPVADVPPVPTALTPLQLPSWVHANERGALAVGRILLRFLPVRNACMMSTDHPAPAIAIAPIQAASAARTAAFAPTCRRDVPKLAERLVELEA